MKPRLLPAFVSLYPAQPATAYWRAIEMEVLQGCAFPTGRGLDLGCGDGKLTRVLLDGIGGRTLVGIDIDQLEIAAAEATGLYERLHCCPAAAVPEPDASFDFVVSNSVLEHIPELPPVLAECGRLLRPGGQVLFTVPAVGFREVLRGSLLPWVTRDRYLAGVDGRLAHHHYHSGRQWTDLFAAAGLALRQVLPYMNAAQVRRWETLSRFTGGLLHALSLHRARPIQIQRTLGLRQFQNRRGLPAGLARLVAEVIARGVPDDAPRDERAAGNLLLIGERV